MEAKLSPSYSHQKLENPSFADLIDVFEDLWRNCFFAQIDLLLCSPNGDVAAMTVLCAYFEAIGGYLSGEDTNFRSKEFFVKVFCLVFRSDSPEITKAAEAIYKYIRCGLAHEGMFSHRVSYSRSGSQPFFLSFPKAADRSLDIDAGVNAMIINPELIHKGVLKHFERYVRALRDAKDKALVDAFKKTVERQWALGTGENYMGMTEAEFLGHDKH